MNNKNTGAIVVACLAIVSMAVTVIFVTRNKKSYGAISLDDYRKRYYRNLNEAEEDE